MSFNLEGIMRQAAALTGMGEYDNPLATFSCFRFVSRAATEAGKKWPGTRLAFCAVAG